MVKNFNFFRGYTDDINLQIETREIAGGVRPLVARWTPELSQDLSEFHNIDIDEIRGRTNTYHQD